MKLPRLLIFQLKQNKTKKGSFEKLKGLAGFMELSDNFLREHFLIQERKVTQITFLVAFLGQAKISTFLDSALPSTHIQVPNFPCGSLQTDPPQTYLYFSGKIGFPT